MERSALSFSEKDADLSDFLDKYEHLATKFKLEDKQKIQNLPQYAPSEYASLWKGIPEYTTGENYKAFINKIKEYYKLGQKVS